MRISKNFTLEELTASATAKKKSIMNVPGAQEMLNMAALVHNILQPLRNCTKSAISISSGYRCAALNKAVGGVPSSQHIKGEAVDIDIKGDLKFGKAMFDWIKMHCSFDQLIWEHNAAGTYWIHVSYRSDGNNRGQIIDDLLKR